MSSEPGPLAKAVTIGVLIIVVATLVAPFVSYKQVPEGHEGVVKNWGAVSGHQYDPGPHWTMPIKQSVQDVEVRPRTFNGTVDVTTLNGTTFDVEYVIRYRVERDQAAAFVKQWNNIEQAEQRMIEPSTEDRLRREGASIQSSIIYQKEGRDQLSDAATEVLEQEFNDEALVLESVQIVNVGIPSDYQDALNKKEIAKQEVQQERYNVEAEQQKKRQQIIEAEADAEAIRIRAQAYEQHPIILEAEYVEALQDGSVFVVPQGGNTPIIIDSEQMNTTTNSTADGIPMNPGGS